MRRSFRKFPVSLRLALGLGLAFLSLLGTGGAKGVVFCIGQNGHRAIEFALNGRCDSPAGEHRPGATSGLNTIPSDHCGPCIDIPIGQITATAPKSEDARSIIETAPAVSVGSALLADAFSFDFGCRFFQRLQYPPGGSTVLMELRSVVLLI